MSPENQELWNKWFADSFRSHFRTRIDIYNKTLAEVVVDFLSEELAERDARLATLERSAGIAPPPAREVREFRARLRPKAPA